MLTKPERSDGTLAGLAILVLGIAIGSLLRPTRWFQRGPRTVHPALAPTLTPVEPQTPADLGLPVLELSIPATSAEVLQRVRDAAMDRGIIVQTDADTVPAELTVDGQRHPVELRIKGDWTDHVESERWSYRIRVKGGASVLGMREFSIQAPRTRGYLWEWLVHEAGRREGLLAPRSTFVQVLQNGHALGVYFLEEHFEKELLEFQGRREGPIVRWDESTLWATLLAEGDVPGKGRRAVPSEVLAPARELFGAEPHAYGEKRLSSVEGLASALNAALEQMKQLRALALLESPELDPLVVLQAMQDLRGRTLEEVVHVEKLGRLHALASLFQIEHGLAWHNLRFYRDPVLARLEPILFDMGAQEPAARDPVPFRAEGLTAAFTSSPRYVDALFEDLGRMVRSGWLDELFDALEPDARRFEAALVATDDLPPGFALDDMKQRLRHQAGWLRHAILPEDAVHFEATYRQDDPDRPDAGVIEVRAWATTRSPVALESFHFSNGSVTPALACVGVESLGAHVRGDALVLPTDGRSIVFRFPMDERLAHLERVEKVTRALRELAEEGATLDLDIQASWRLLAAEESHRSALVFRRQRPGPATGADRPRAPDLAEALERHAFLRHDPARHELRVAAGEWDVAGDLVLPEGVPLVIGPGTTLRFAEDALLLASAPLRFAGTPEAPVVLEPLAGAPRWRGVIVLEAGGRSSWRDVVVRHTDAVQRGGWVVTGGVTFYRSPLTMQRCHIEGTLAEDGLNVFGADVLFENVLFEGCVSDSFDGDFITGSIVGCTFQDGQADGIDVSGSDVEIRDCRFLRLLDKGCSIGEDSRARIIGGLVDDVGVGVASKDRSETTVEGLVLRKVRHYALAAFVKKPAYGPARLSARNVRIEDAGLGRALAQTGCSIEIDTVSEPTQDVDVEASYREGILGRAK
jgi:hypothetical protein